MSNILSHEAELQSADTSQYIPFLVSSICSGMKDFLKRAGGFLSLLLCFYLLLNFLIWRQLTGQLRADETETIQAAIQHNNNLVISLEQHTLRILRDADATLHQIKTEYERGDKKIDFEKLLNSSMIGLPLFDGFVITDAKGDVVLSYPDSLAKQNINLSDRDYFHLHQTVADTLHITKPLTSRSIHKSVLVLSRRITDREGRFAGVIAIQLQPSVFMSFYQRASVNPYDFLSLIAPDGITYSRRTGGVESFGEDIHKSPLFVHLKEKETGSYFAKDAIRSIPSYISYRKLDKLPIIATVGSSEENILHKFRQRRQRELFFGGITSFLLFVFLLAVFLVFLQRKRSTHQLKKSEARYRSIFESSQDALLLLKPNGHVEAMNSAAHAMFRLDFREDEEFSFWQLFEKTEPKITHWKDHANCLCIEGKEVLFYTLNGSKFIGDLASSSFLDGHDNPYSLVQIRDVTHRKRMEFKLQNEQKRYRRILTKQIIIAQEREREIIGHELHDNVNQILTTVKLYLEMALQNEGSQKELIKRSIGHLMNCISEIRNLSHSLSAPTLGTQSLIDSLQALIENVSGCAGVDINLCVEKYKQPISKELSLAIYRIVQEQVNNIIKHANATTATILLSQTETETHLLIEDNGKGFDPMAQSKGIGLNNIRSRIKAFNGSLSIQSAEGKGCRLCVQLPHTDEGVMVNSEEDAGHLL